MFFKQMKLQGLNPEFLLTDKDFSQITASQRIWPNTKIQLCRWHIKRSVEARLASNKLSQRNTYVGLTAHHKFSFIKNTFVPPSPIPKDTIFCPKELRKEIWKMMDKHLHLHPLILTNNQSLSSSEIWELAVNEMYMYCEQHSLPFLWTYMWKEWYCSERWILWMRAGCENKISVLKTTMIMESHWKVLKRDFLYKFFRPRLDLVVFIITKKVYILLLINF